MNIIKRVINKYRKHVYNSKYRAVVKETYQKRLVNSDFSIMCNNCLGGMLYHDLGMRFLSPTINMYIKANDYLEFLENLDYYLMRDLTDGGYLDQVNGGGVLAILDNKISLYGLHYTTFDDMAQKWYERRKRVNINNLFIIGSYRDGCNDSLVERFCALPYKNKIFFSHKPFPHDCVIEVSEYKNEAPPADAMASCKMRLYDKKFDFVNWINEGMPDETV